MDADVTSRLRMRLGDRFSYSQNPDTYIDVGAGSGSREWQRKSGNHYNNRAFIDLNYRMSPTFFSTADAYHRILRYTDSGIAGMSDQTEYGASIGLNKRQTAHLNLGVFGAYRNFSKKQADWGGVSHSNPDFNMETATLGVNVSYNVTASSELRGQWGYTWAWYGADFVDDERFPSVVDVSLKSALDPRVDVVIGYTRELRAAEVGTFVSTLDNRGYAMLSARHTERWVSTYRAEYRYTSYSDRQSVVATQSGYLSNLFLRLGLNYRATDDLLLSTYYSVAWQRSTLGTNQWQPSFHRNTIGVRAEYTF